MAARKKFNIDTCKECLVWWEHGNPGEGFCRLNPPTPCNAYTSSYPVVRADNIACFAGQAGSKPKPKGMVKKK